MQKKLQAQGQRELLGNQKKSTGTTHKQWRNVYWPLCKQTANRNALVINSSAQIVRRHSLRTVTGYAACNLEPRVTTLNMQIEQPTTQGRARSQFVRTITQPVRIALCKKGWQLTAVACCVGFMRCTQSNIFLMYITFTYCALWMCVKQFAISKRHLNRISVKQIQCFNVHTHLAW